MTPQSRLTVIVPRPPEQGAAFGAALTAALGVRVTVLLSPLMGPVWRVVTPPTGMGAVIYTSATAVAWAVQSGAALPRRAWCVGAATAGAARAAGHDARSADGDAAALVRHILDTGGGDGPFLHLRGAEAAGDVVGALQRAGVAAQACVVYDQRPIAPTAAARAALSSPGPVVVPLFSPRQAQIFSALPDVSARLWLASLSPAVDHAATVLAERRIISRQPDSPAMITAIARLIDA